MADRTPSGSSNAGSSPRSKRFSQSQLIVLWLILGAAAVLWSGVLTRNQPQLQLIARWIATMVMMLVLLAFVGFDINGRWAGFLRNEN